MDQRHHPNEADPVGPASFVLPDSTRLWIVRHGETEWSKAGWHTGRTDVPLLPEGETQASALQPIFADVHPVLVLSSPRQRARRTAELAGFTVDDIDEDLSEWDYGDFERISSHEIRKTDPTWQIWTHGVPNGETIEQISARADRVIARVVPHLAKGPVVLFSHGHMSRVLGARWIGLPASAGANFLLSTAAPSLLGAQYGSPAITHWNIPNPAGGTA